MSSSNAVPHDDLTAEQRDWRAVTTSHFRRQAIACALAVALGLAVGVGALVSIAAHPDSTGALVGAQLGLLGLALVLTVAGISPFFLPVLPRLRRAQRWRWTQQPARVAEIRWGPFALTVLGIEFGDDIAIIFPEIPFRRRLRHLIAAQGTVLVLAPPTLTTTDAIREYAQRNRYARSVIYAALSGRTVFSNAVVPYPLSRTIPRAHRALQRSAHP